MNFINKLKKISIRDIVVLLFSFMFSAALVFGSNVVYTDLGHKYDKVYVNDINNKQIFIFIGVALIVYFLIVLVSHFLKKYGGFVFENKAIDKSKNKKIFFITFAIICIAWMPYVLSYYPGTVFSDGFTSINQSLYTGVDNHHTLLYTYFISIFAHLGKAIGNMSIAIFIYTIIQFFVMSAVLSYFLVWLLNKKINKIYVVICLVLFAICPLFPYYAITTWKDTYFSLALLLFILLLIDFIKKDKVIKKNIIYALTLVFLICFLRNNGIYIIIFTFACFALFNINKIFNEYRKLTILSVITIFVIYLIQGPLYNLLNLNTEYVEKIAIPMQQVAAVVSYDGEYKEQEEIISNIWSLDEIKSSYTPCLADTMKWYLESFNEEYLNEHKSEFMKAWSGILKNNVKICLDAYALETLGYWHFGYQSSVCYIQDGVWDNFYNVERVDYFEKIFGFSFADIVSPKHYISSGLLFWIIVIFAMINLKMNGFRKTVPFALLLGIWITIMIATPIAFSLRYVYIFVLAIPLVIVAPLILDDEKGKVLELNEVKNNE